MDPDHKYAILLLIILHIGMYIFIFGHENAHVVVSKQIASCDARTDYFYGTAVTHVWNCSFPDENWLLAFETVNAQNEVVGYNLIGLMFFLFVCIVVLLKIYRKLDSIEKRIQERNYSSFVEPKHLYTITHNNKS